MCLRRLCVRALTWIILALATDSSIATLAGSCMILSDYTNRLNKHHDAWWFKTLTLKGTAAQKHCTRSMMPVWVSTVAGKIQHGVMESIVCRPVMGSGTVYVWRTSLTLCTFVVAAPLGVQPAARLSNHLNKSETFHLTNIWRSQKQPHMWHVVCKLKNLDYSIQSYKLNVWFGSCLAVLR